MLRNLTNNFFGSQYLLDLSDDWTVMESSNGKRSRVSTKGRFTNRYATVKKTNCFVVTCINAMYFVQNGQLFVDS